MSTDAISNAGPRLIDTSSLQGSEEVSARVQDLLKAVNLTIVGMASQIEGPGGEIRIRLENPTIGIEDIPLNEFLQNLESLARTPTVAFASYQALGHLADAAAALGESVAQAKPAGTPPNSTEIGQLATALADQAGGIERSLLHLIENSTYPNFSDFLKDMVKIAQELREKATEMKLAAAEGKYDLMMKAADQMIVAANEAKTSRDNKITAEKNEAWMSIASGGFTLLSMGLFGGQTGGMLGGTVGQLGKAGMTLATAGLKYDASNADHRADLANAAKTRLEAAAQLMDGEIQVADDLREIAKGLRDMALKMYQDFISTQNQTLQRANV